MAFAAGRKPALAAPSTVTATKRIKKEIADLAKENLGSITLTPNESNIFVWRATIPGPAGSPYEGGVFDVDIRIPENYPFSPPQLQFLTKVYHCNINSNGGICLDLLKHAWSPALSLYKVILSLSSLLTDPNPADPLVPQVAQELRRNKKKHDDTAREWVKLYAKPKAPPPVPTPLAVPAPARPRPASRTNTSSTSASASASVPPAQIAGTRRTHAQANASASGTAQRSGGRVSVIDLADDSEEDAASDVELVSGSSRANGTGTTGNPGIGATTNGGSGARNGTKRSKRARVGEGGRAGEGDDVIVVDD